MTRRTTWAAAALCLGLLTTGCSAPALDLPRPTPWSELLDFKNSTSSDAAAHSVASPAPLPAVSAPAEREPEPTPVPPPAPEFPPFTDDFVAGSRERLQPAGASMVKTSYWSALSNDQWTPGAIKPLTIQVTADSRNQVELQGLRVFAEALTPTGWVDASASVQQPTVVAGTQVRTPHAAQATVVIGSVPTPVRALRLTTVVTLVESTGKLSAQASATDAFVIGLAGGVQQGT